MEGVLRVNWSCHGLSEGDYYAGNQKRGKNGVRLAMQAEKGMDKLGEDDFRPKS